jgi:hypothetical protein
MLTFASGFTSGFTLKEVLSFVLRRHRAKRERRLDDAIVGYLIREVETHQATIDGYGQASTPYYRRTSEIADATKQKSVGVLQRLERLETEKRILRCGGPRSDAWTVTQHELHDHSRP